ncbi:MAG: Flp pilus assembly complex ATPase component TadA [Victivallales bacterium]|nr:Flp pilus assembly complex ATPase component TadA [Victivallales bacterium]
MTENADYILELLTEYGMVGEEQVEAGWKRVEDSAGELDIIDALLDLGLVEKDQMMALLAQQYGLETLNLANYRIPEEIISEVPAEVAFQYNILPVMKHDDILTIAMSNPAAIDTLDTLRYLLKCDVDAVISPEDQITRLIPKYYGSSEESVEAVIDEFEVDQASLEYQLGAIGDANSSNSEDETPIIRLVSLILMEAYRMKASDIHLEPMEKRYRIRYRVDGALREVEAPPKYLQANLTQRLKIMAKLDITEKRVPQDGRIQLRIDDKDIDLRVSSVPTTHGESIVMRILDKASIQLEIPHLGFYTDDQEKIDKIINMPDGIFLVTGPTGSGKTTSLYAFLNSINTPNRKIITVEDPIEYQLSGINQVQADKQIGLTFALALRSMLRQAPNIIMVGEIRELDTAEIAINASLTGHLVFSTLHTNDAPSTITRLVDMGVPSFMIGQSVRAIMAQRLLRRVCKNCAAPYEPSPSEIRILGLTEDFLAKSKFFKGKGCSECNQTGYKGRVGTYEILMITDAIRDLIFSNATTNVLRDAAIKDGMNTLRDDALRKAVAGTTTLDEVIRLTVASENTDEEIV